MTMKELKGNATVQMVLDHYTEQVGWVEEDQVSLLGEFIEGLGPKVQEDFKKFIHDKASEEDEEDLDEEDDLDADDEEEGEEELLEDEE